MAEPQQQKGLSGIMLMVAMAIVAGILLIGLLGCVVGVLEVGFFGEKTNVCGASAAEWMLRTTGLILGLAGMLVDYIVIKWVIDLGSVLSFGQPLARGISTAWEVVRDVMNLAFIGGLVYAAFSMILQINPFGSKPGKLIVSILIAAILVNFSYFIAGAVVDASNFTSKIIYEQSLRGSVTTTTEDGGEAVGFEQHYGDLTLNLMYAIGIGSIYDFTEVEFDGSNDIQLFMYGFMGSLLFVTTAAAFIYMSGLFFKRVVVIIYLLVTSPLGVVGFTGIPIIKQWGQAWWKTLAAQAIFPPVFFFLIAIAYGVIAQARIAINPNSSLTEILNPENVNTGDFATTFNGNLDLIALFAISIGLVFLATRMSANISQEIETKPWTSKTLTSGYTKGLQVGIKGLAGGFGFWGKAIGRPAVNIPGGIASWGGRKFRENVPFGEDIASGVGRVTGGIRDRFTPTPSKTADQIKDLWKPLGGKTGYDKYSDEQIWDKNSGLLSQSWNSLSESQQKQLAGIFGAGVMDNKEFGRNEKRAKAMGDTQRDTLYAARLGNVGGGAIAARDQDIQFAVGGHPEGLSQNESVAKLEEIRKTLQEQGEVTGKVATTLHRLRRTEQRELIAEQKEVSLITSLLSALGKKDDVAMREVIDTLPTQMLVRPELAQFIDQKTIEAVGTRTSDPASPRQIEQIKTNLTNRGVEPGSIGDIDSSRDSK